MGIRTPGLVIANDALYQLSYTPPALEVGGRLYRYSKGVYYARIRLEGKNIKRSVRKVL